MPLKKAEIIFEISSVIQ